MLVKVADARLPSKPTRRIVKSRKQKVDIDSEIESDGYGEAGLDMEPSTIKLEPRSAFFSMFCSRSSANRLIRG
jgi:hypothetical protein